VKAEPPLDSKSFLASTLAPQNSVHPLKLVLLSQANSQHCQNSSLYLIFVFIGAFKMGIKNKTKLGLGWVLIPLNINYLIVFQPS